MTVRYSYYLVLLILIYSCLKSKGFFFSNKKKTDLTNNDNDNEEKIFSKIKGVPEYLEESYLKLDNFTCNNKEKVIRSNEINDEFCDCLDGSDEPGTSACASNGKFHCINKGYRTILIPSSRVDDGVCDCCDGSDEGKLIKCENSCIKAAEKEKALLEKLINSYKVGSKLRTDAENAVKSQLQSIASSLPQLENESKDVTQQIDSLRSNKIDAEQKIIESLETFKSESLNLAKYSTDISSFDLNTLISFTSSLFDCLDFSLNDVRSIADLSEKTYDNDENENESLKSEEYDEYGEDTSVAPPPIEDIELPKDSINDKCLNGITTDIRLSFLCDLSNDSNFKDNLLEFIYTQLFAKKRPFAHVQSILGYYRLYHTFNNSSEFSKKIIESSTYNDIDTCPASLENAPLGTCTISKTLHNLYSNYDLTIDKYDNPSDQQLQSYKNIINVYNSLSSHLEKVKTKKEEAERANNYLSTIYYPFLYYNNQEISVKDGVYTYTFLILEKITQNEEGKSSTLLGQFDGIDEFDNGNYIIKFKDGDYCWNVGARKAFVKLQCGNENKLLSASEPSTCEYHFEMESPFGCTRKYAQVNGILNHVN